MHKIELMRENQKNLENGTMLPIMEDFYTLQGEGFHTGKAAYFLRIGGCDVGCNFCDVKEAWNANIHPLVSVDKIVKKEARRLKKEGWLVKPGELPLEKQLERVYMMQYEYDENLYPKFIMGEASSVGEQYDAAKMAATSLAVANLAGQIQTEITALVENTAANRQLSVDEAASITESVMSSKNLISQSIGRTLPVMECYRMTKKNSTEVLVRLAYNGDLAKEAILPYYSF